jgi:hypothetical protein
LRRTSSVSDGSPPPKFGDYPVGQEYFNYLNMLMVLNLYNFEVFYTVPSWLCQNGAITTA